MTPIKGSLVFSLLVISGCGTASTATPKNEFTADAEVRSVYPLSLIPGGVASDAEFETARSADPILEEHYAEVGFLHPTFLTHDQWLYASYRQGHSVVWTNNRVRVHAGEVLLADRNGNLVRGRCGNRLSETPRGPVAFVEPPEVAFDMPEISFPEPPLPLQSSQDDLSSVSVPPFPPIEAPTFGAGIRPVPTTVLARSPGWNADDAFVPSVILFGPSRFAAVIPPVVAPEPGAASLLVAGAVILISCGFRVVRGKRSQR